MLQEASVIACDVSSPVSHQAAWLQAYGPAFITMRIQATSTSAGVRLAMPAQISFSHLRKCSGPGSTGVHLCSKVQSESLIWEQTAPMETAKATDFTDRLEYPF